MKRIYEPLAYTDRPIRDRYWDRYWDRFLPAPSPSFPQLIGEQHAEVAVVGGGYLVSVGSARMEGDQIIRKYGAEDARKFFDAERAAVDLVEEYLDRFDLDVERHSKGYTYLTHRPKVVEGLKEYGQEYTDRYGLPYMFIPKEEMADHGMSSPDFHGAVNLPIGFALNPMKFVLGLTRATGAAGVRMFFDSPVTKIADQGQYLLTTLQGRLRADKVLICTNGYSSDDLPRGFAGRYLPVQSNILVTRPMSNEERPSRAGPANRCASTAARCCITSACCRIGACF